jgi:hypothetical protein
VPLLLDGHEALQGQGLGGAGQTRAGCSAAAVTVAWPGRETLLQVGVMCEVGKAPRSLEEG